MTRQDPGVGRRARSQSGRRRLMTDEERAATALRGSRARRLARADPGRTRWFREHGVSFERHYTGRWRRAVAADDLHRPLPRPARRHPRPTGSARPRTTPGCGGCRRARCRRSATGSGRPATTPTTTGSGTSATPTCTTSRAGASRPTPPTASRSRPRAGLPRRRPAGAVRLLRLGRPRAARAAIGDCGVRLRPAHRRPRRRLARGPLRPPRGR